MPTADPSIASSVTVVLPLYNGTRYLHEAIESVLQQSCPAWTLLILDDASGDNPSQILVRYPDARIKYFRNNRNLGLYGTLLRALALTDAAWIAILMQDDRLKPRYLEEMLALARKYPQAQAIWATEDIIDDRGAVLRPGRGTRREELLPPGVAPWLGALRRGCIWTISGSFTRRSLLSALPFRPDLPHCADYDWFLRAIRAVPFLYFEEILTDLREHPAQASAGNLRSGRDLRESYQVLRANLCEFSGDVPRKEAARICGRRFRLILRRAAGNFAKLRLTRALGDLAYSFRFLTLMAVYHRAK